MQWRKGGSSYRVFSIKALGLTLTAAFEPWKTGMGLLLGAVSLVSGWSVASWYVGVAFGLLYGFLGFFKIESTEKRLTDGLNILWGMAVLVLLPILGPMMIRVFTFFQMGLWKAVLNVVCCAILCAIALALTADWRKAVTAAAVVGLILSTVNGYVYLFRNRELAFLDIFSATTAVAVAGQYRFTVTKAMLCSWLLGGAALFSQWCLPKRKPEKKGLIRLGAVIGTVVLALLLHFGASGIQLASWGRDGSRKNGLFLNLYLSYRNASVEKPENYSPETVDACLRKYAGETEPAGKKPNILVIMDEAYADFRIFSHPPVTNTPVSPYMDSLKENVIRGYALSSVFGGNTASSEFEFFTGHSMAYLPANSVPYQQYIQGPVFTLPWLLRSYGYTCKATHSYHGKGWARDVTYPRLGFEESTFQDAYPGKDLIRTYISDYEQFAYMLDMLKDKPKDQPLFLFGVTMQNHGGYTYSGGDYTQTVFLEGYDQSYPQAEQYLSLMKETDRALEFLLTSLEDYPEDTVVLIFGDHLPMIEDSFYEQMNGGAFDSQDAQMLKYKVPFVIWANFDIGEQQIPCTSLNYLAGHLMNAAGLELPAYYRFLSDMEKVIPAINARCFYSPEKGCFLPLDKAEGKAAEMLALYRMMQYNNLFDPQNRSEEFFARYLPGESDP